MLRHVRVQLLLVLPFAAFLVIRKYNCKDFNPSIDTCENRSVSYNVEWFDTSEAHKTEKGGTISARTETTATKGIFQCFQYNNDINVSQEIDTCLRFMTRKETLEKACSRLRSNLDSKNCILHSVARNMKYVKQKELLYCSIEKTGSTFWKRILHIAGGWRNVTNPTDIGLVEAFTEKGGFRSMKGKHWTDIYDIFKHARSIAFVRNPYTRLFSGWLDKFYSPNAYYWKSAGRNIIKTQRNQESDTKCGYDVSFAEFVNFTVHNVLSSPCLDGHFQSNYLHCLPCNFSFDYIGKYETIKEDTMHLLDAFNLSARIQFRDFETDAALDAIRDASGWVFTQRRSITHDCGVPFACALFRVWNRLQSRGVISCKLIFPYKSNRDTSNISKQNFESVLMDAYKRSNVNETRYNRETALIQALRTLPKSVVKLIQKAFYLDFELFRYDVNPFVPFDPTNSNTFTYFQNCPHSLS